MAKYFINSFKCLSLDKSQIAANIRKFREEKGFKQNDIVEIFDVSHTIANRWENVTNPKTPSLVHLCNFAKLFGVKVEDLIATVEIDDDFVTGEETTSYETGKTKVSSTKYPEYENKDLKNKSGKKLSGTYEMQNGIIIRVNNGKLDDVHLENGEILPAIETPEYYIEHWINGMFVTAEQNTSYNEENE